MQLAFRVDLETREDLSCLRPINPTKHYIVPGDRFLHAGIEWECEAVVVKYRDGVPYPAEAKRIVIAGNRASIRSIVVDARECERIDE
jgi:hypothetical protein